MSYVYVGQQWTTYCQGLPGRVIVCVDWSVTKDKVGGPQFPSKWTKISDLSTKFKSLMCTALRFGMNFLLFA